MLKKLFINLGDGDAHIFRNAGGLVTDDAIRSAMLTTNFFGTEEIIVINHTECGMMTATGEYLAGKLKSKINIDKEPLNPALPALKLEDQAKNFAQWIQMFTNVDETCNQQISLLKNSPFIPKNVKIHGYVWEIESMNLRKPNIRLSEKVNTAEQMHPSK